MNRIINFFNYEGCFSYYVKCIDNIHQHKRNGETILAKPVFLIAIIDGIDENVFCDNRFVINDWLEERFVRLLSKYTVDSQFEDITGIEKPYWHLESDGFWLIDYPGERLSKSRTPSKAWLKGHVNYAFFETSLWIMLQSKEWRTKLREYIVENKIEQKISYYG